MAVRVVCTPYHEQNDVSWSQQEKKRHSEDQQIESLVFYCVWRTGPGALSCIGKIGTWGPKGYGFLTILAFNRVWPLWSHTRYGFYTLVLNSNVVRFFKKQCLSVSVSAPPPQAFRGSCELSLACVTSEEFRVSVACWSRENWCNRTLTVTAW